MKFVAVHGGWGIRRRLAEMGLNPGVKIKVIQGGFNRGPIIVAIRDVRMALGRGMTHKINERRNSKELTITLAGNPNSGKSTVFNALTGARQHVGNWPGKTVEKHVSQPFHASHRFRHPRGSSKGEGWGRLY